MPHARHHGFDRHGNPKHMRAYLDRLLSPDRDAWQMPDRVVRALGLRKGQTVGEIGAGPGYFTLRLSRAVGRTGSVLAVEVEPKMIELLRDRLEKERRSNVTPVLGLGPDPLLPPASCQLILAVNVLHHLPGLAGYLRRLRRSLAPRGRIAAIDFLPGETPVGPPPDHKLPRQELLRAAARAGLRLAAEPSFLPHQYFLLLAPA